MSQNRRESDDDGTPMRAVSHTNPYTNESMGSVFEHGVTIVADGGRRDAVDEPATADADATSAAEDADETEDASDETEDASTGTPMKDVSHEAPDGGHGNRMFERVGDTADVSEE